MVEIISSAVRTRSIFQSCWASSGMNSIKRTSMPRARPKRTNSGMSGSFRPLMATELIFTWNPASRAASIPAKTRGRSSRRLMIRKRSRSSVSRCTFKRCKPASNSGLAAPANSTALVVRAKSWMPANSDSEAIKSGSLGRSSGSPPVKRILRIPRGSEASTKRRISAKLS